MTDWTPAAGDFVLIVRGGRTRYAAKVIGFDWTPAGRPWALVRQIGDDADPHPVPLGELRRHPLSTQRSIPEA